MENPQNPIEIMDSPRPHAAATPPARRVLPYAAVPIGALPTNTTPPTMTDKQVTPAPKMWSVTQGFWGTLLLLVVMWGFAIWAAERGHDELAATFVKTSLCLGPMILVVTTGSKLADAIVKLVSRGP